MFKKRIEDFSIIDKKTESELERHKLNRLAISIIIAVLSFTTLVLSANIALSMVEISKQFPDIELIKEFKPDQTTLIYDINDKLVANIHGDEDRVLVSLKQVSPLLKYAVISIEDNRFYDHKGVDLVGTMRAAANNFTGKDDSSTQGGSTITQQFVKNSFLSPERSIKRKLVEAILAVRVERLYSKEQILEMYLNQVYWGNLSYGVQKASKRYFKKSAKDLNLAEASLLAGLLKAPEGYSPYTNLKGAKKRQKQVLERMAYYGYITQRQRRLAEKEPVKLASRTQSYSKYPYFVDFIAYKLRNTYGDEAVRRGGFKVYTTLDPEVQEIAEKTINEGVKTLSKSTGVKQGALVSINVDNGYVQALVGGVNFKKSNYNRAVYARRPAGSSFKPVVYLSAFRRGFINSESPIVDAPISFNTGWNIWSPHNWDGKYMGKMTVRQALSLSRNTTTVRVGLKVGLDTIIHTARLLGFRGPINKDFSIVLGSAGVTPLEMATIYSTFARDGAYVEPIAIRRIEDSKGNIIEVNYPTPVQVVSTNFVAELNSILVDVVDKGTGKAAKLPGRVVAGKTGTTDEVKDIWFTGFTPDVVTSIWMGNDQNLPLHGVFSSNCAELWGIFSKEYYKLKGTAPRSFTPYKKVELIKSKNADLNKNKKKDDSEISELKKTRAKNSKKINKTRKKPDSDELEYLYNDEVKNNKPEQVGKKEKSVKKNVVKRQTPEQGSENSYNSLNQNDIYSNRQPDNNVIQENGDLDSSPNSLNLRPKRRVEEMKEQKKSNNYRQEYRE